MFARVWLIFEKEEWFMLLPRIFSDSLTDDYFDEMFRFPFGNQKTFASLMQTDVKDLGTNYELNIELPGYGKEEIKAELKNGYLVVSAEHTESKEEKEDSGKFVRKERYSGKCRRSYYVGENVKQEDIQAKFENGILVLNFPKEDEKQKISEKKMIMIE